VCWFGFRAGLRYDDLYDAYHDLDIREALPRDVVERAAQACHGPLHEAPVPPRGRPGEDLLFVLSESHTFDAQFGS
jgi:hypothetical protein